MVILLAAFFSHSMKRPNTISLLLAVSAVIAATATASDRWETLRAIHWVENPTNQTHFGPKGELGPYQFRIDTWRRHTSRPFSDAIIREVSDEVAVKHYEWLKAELSRAGIDPSPFNIALAWNCGLGAVRSGRIPDSTYGYAERVTNLVAGLKARERSVLAAAGPASPVAAPAPAVQNEPPAFSLGDEDNGNALRFAVVREASLSPQFSLMVKEGEGSIPVVRTDSAPEMPAPPKPMFLMATVTGPRFTL